MNFGAHFSIKDGLVGATKEAVSYQATTFQIFSRNPRGRSAKKITAAEIAEATEIRQQNGIKTFYVHTPYYTNLASPKQNVWGMSIGSVVADLKTAAAIGSGFFVMHIGNHLGQGVAAGIKRVAAGLQSVAAKDKSATKLLLEITAGQGTEVGNNFDELAEIIKQSEYPDKKIGIVFDTAHAFGAGYDLRTEAAVQKTMAELDKKIGFDKLQLIHCNDSAVPLGSHKDRHAHIGQGEIGLEGFRALVNHPALKDKDFVVETKEPGRRQDIETLRSLVK
jgi:deoxyribonuclease IV